MPPIETQHNLLIVQGNLAIAYRKLGRDEEALSIRREVYSGTLKLNGEEHEDTLTTANNYAGTLRDLLRFEEARSLLRKTIPVARRVLGEGNDTTLRMRCISAEALYMDPGATLDDLREAVTTLEEAERTARRVLGGAHPLTMDLKLGLRNAQVVLRAPGS